MRRYGHEGFLVVTESARSRDDGTLLVDDLLGLLTRRDAEWTATGRRVRRSAE